MSLLSLPFDALLDVLRDLDIIDVIRTGMTYKDLYKAIQARYVWVDQLEKLCRKHPALRSATPPLTSLSARELKTLATGRVKLRLRWDKDGSENDFVAKGLTAIHRADRLWLLPGGKSVLTIDNRGGVTLRRIELEDNQISLPIVTNVKHDQWTDGVAGRSVLLTTMSPCPILVHRQGKDMHLLKVDHHNAAMSSETAFPMSEEYFVETRGQGRVVGFLARKHRESPRAIVIHLDYPGVNMVFEVSPIYIALSAWSICIPNESLIVVYDARHVLVYNTPDFSNLSCGNNLSSGAPMWYWPGPERVNEGIGARLSYVTGEALHDPLSAQEFNLHYVCKKFAAVWSHVTTVTVPITTKTDSPSESIDDELLALKQKSALIQSHGRNTVSLSCRKGLHLDVAFHAPGLEALVTPLNDLISEGGRGALRIPVPLKKLRRCSGIDMDMDEATGRVVIWGWDEDTHRTKVFVGDLV